MSDVPELKPCPFCGGRPRIITGAVAFKDIEITCDPCGFSGPNYGALDDIENPLKEAVQHWNSRADIADDKLQRAADLLAECAADLAVYIETGWPEQTRAAHKGIQNKWDRDMELVRRVEAMVAEIKC